MELLIALIVYIVGSVVTLAYDKYSCHRHHMIYDLKLSLILAVFSWIGVGAIICYERSIKRKS